MAHLHPGIVFICPMGAKLSRDTASISMDPYCLIRIGESEQQTEEHKSGDKLPSWNTKLTFRVLPGDDVVGIEVWDKNVMAKDQKIGSATLPLFDLFSRGLVEDWVELMHEGMSAGHIRINLSFQPDKVEEKPKPSGTEQTEPLDIVMEGVTGVSEKQYESSEQQSSEFKQETLYSQEKHPSEQEALGSQAQFKPQTQAEAKLVPEYKEKQEGLRGEYKQVEIIIEDVPGQFGQDGFQPSSQQESGIAKGQDVEEGLTQETDPSKASEEIRANIEESKFIGQEQTQVTQEPQEESQPPSQKEGMAYREIAEEGLTQESETELSKAREEVRANVGEYRFSSQELKEQPQVTQEPKESQEPKPVSFSYGMVYVKPLHAKIIRDVAQELMDPYCVFKISEVEKVSEESKQGDKAPMWNESLNFFVTPNDNYISITLRDKKALSRDKVIGSASLPLFKLFATQFVEDWIELMHEGQSAGHIKITMNFNPDEKPESIKEKGENPAEPQQEPIKSRSEGEELIDSKRERQEQQYTEASSQ